MILLDLRRDKYLAVGGTQVGDLAEVIADWPRAPAAPERRFSGDVSALAAGLLRKGLLTENRPSRERPLDASVPEAVASLDALDPVDEPVAVPARALLRFLRSAAMAAATLRCRSLLAAARAVALRRARFDDRQHEFPIEAARRAVSVYETLRPLVFTSRDRCLFDSLALIHFLACQGMYPRWVIGVATRPFAAHAWVQSGGLVVNDLHERVRRYTPILVV